MHPDLTSPAPLRTLVTGATGYVGRHIIQHWQEEKIPVAAICRPNSNVASTLPEATRTYAYDGSIDSLRNAFSEFQPELVIHLATHYDSQGQADPRDLLEANVIFGTQLLNCMAQTGCRNFISTGTYWQHYQNAAYSPFSLYAASKQAFSDILRYYCECQNIHAVSLELTDIYGPADPRPRLLQQLQQALKTEEQIDMTLGEQFIDLLHIDDLVNAVSHTTRLLARSDTTALQTYGVTGGHAQTLKQLVSRIEQVAGKSLRIQWGARPYRQREMMEPWCNQHPLPGWAPQITLDKGLASVFVGHS